MSLPLKQEPSSGGTPVASPEKKPDVQRDRIKLHVQLPDSGEVVIVCRPSSTILKVMEGVAKERNLNVNQLRLMIDGKRLMRERTVAQSELKDGDELQVVIEQIGGHLYRL